MTRILYLLLTLSLLPLPAQAYFDPGAGSVLLQLLIASGIGLVFKLRHWLASLVMAIKRLLNR